MYRFSIHELAHFGVLGALTSPYIVWFRWNFQQMYYSMGQKISVWKVFEKSFKNSNFYISGRLCLRFFTFGRTFGPIYPRNMAEIDKTKYPLGENLFVRLSKYRKIKALSLLNFFTKNTITFSPSMATFGRISTKVKGHIGSESKIVIFNCLFYQNDSLASSRQKN